MRVPLTEDLFVLKLIVVFLSTFVFIKLIIRFSDKLGLVDVPNHRSIHKSITARGAGIGIVFGVMISDILFMNNLILTHATSFLAIFIVFVVGILDDHRDTTPKTKFYVIFLAVLFLAYDNMMISSLGELFGHHLMLGWLSLPFTMFAVAGFTNALNLSDGLDGLAGLLSIIILCALCFIGYQNNDIFIVSTSLSFVSAIAAFMWFNWNPAQIFMGDSGSLTLGFVISLLSIKALAYINPISVLFIAAIPILDTLIVMIRRKRNGYSMFSPDNLHIHHILLRFFNGNVKKVVFLIGLLQLAFSMTGIAFSKSENQHEILMLFTVNIAIFYILLNEMIKRKSKFSIHKNKRKH